MKKISGIYIMPSSRNRRQRRQRQSQRRQRNQRQRGGNKDLKTLLIEAEEKKVKDAEELITELQNLPADVESDNTESDVAESADAKPFTFGETKTPKEGEGSADADEVSDVAGEGEEVNVITDAEVDKAEEKEEEMPGGRRKSRRRKQRKNRKSQRRQRRR